MPEVGEGIHDGNKYFDDWNLHSGLEDGIHLDAPIKGVLRKQMDKVEALVGEDVRGYLKDTIDQGLSEEDVAMQLSDQSGEKIHTYTIFMLKHYYILKHIPEPPASKSSTGLSRRDNHKLFERAIRENLIDVEDWGEVEQVLYYTQSFGKRMSYARLSEDLGKPKPHLTKTASKMVRQVRTVLGINS
jgi:hypothetical protein